SSAPPCGVPPAPRATHPPRPVRHRSGTAGTTGASTVAMRCSIAAAMWRGALGGILAAALACAPTAAARVIRAGSVLPPGQSGYVALTGLADGTGSPHLNDQTDLFVHFDLKPATFNPPGQEEDPRDGVKIVRDRYGVPDVTGRTNEDVWWGAGYAMAQD